MDIQEYFQEYRFIDDNHQDGGAGEAEAGASIDCSILTERTYEEPVRWFLCVFKPFNRAYLKDTDWFRVKGLDRCRKWFKKPCAYTLTREIDAEKVHINAIVATDDDLLKKHNSVLANKYKVHIQHLKTRADVENAITYIYKESSKRNFTKYLDYVIYRRQ